VSTTSAMSSAMCAALCPQAAMGGARGVGATNRATDRSIHRRNNGSKRWVRPIAPGRRGASETRPDVSTEALTPPKSDADVAAMRARLKEKQQRLMDKIATRKELQAVREQLKKTRESRRPRFHPGYPPGTTPKLTTQTSTQPPPNRS